MLYRYFNYYNLLSLDYCRITEILFSTQETNQPVPILRHGFLPQDEFFMVPSDLSRGSRRVCTDIPKLRRAARHRFLPVEKLAFQRKRECIVVGLYIIIIMI